MIPGLTFYFGIRRFLSTAKSITELEAEGCISPLQVYSIQRSMISTSDKIYFYNFFLNHFGIKLLSLNGSFSKADSCIYNETEEKNSQNSSSFTHDYLDKFPDWSFHGYRNVRVNKKRLQPKSMSLSCVPLKTVETFYKEDKNKIG